MTPYQIVLDRLGSYKLREQGPDRARAICPCCGERNNNTLSVGQTADGAVLLKCFKSGCDVASIAGALGLELRDLFPPRLESAPRQKRTRLLSPSQALELLADESQLIVVVASDMVSKRIISDTDYERLATAAARVATIQREVQA